jgi:deoxyribodipyrimidine photo-lyase
VRTLVWFRGKDLRLTDHAPLRAAMATGEVLPVFVLDPFFFSPERAQLLPNRIQFLLESLTALGRNLEACGSRLLIESGRSVEVIPELARRWRVDRVVAQRWVEPFARHRDREVARLLPVPFELFEGETLLPPGTLRSGTGTPYAVFTRFAQAFSRTAKLGAPLARPKQVPAPAVPDADGRTAIPSLEALGIERNPRILPGGERAGQARLKAFLGGGGPSYDTARDRMDQAGTSRLSADLKFGTLSVRWVWQAAERALGTSAAGTTFLNELLWREFAHHTLWDRPELLRQPFRKDFRGFPWLSGTTDWDAWVNGTTGYPVVDAAQRQLLAEGFVHNRARMITASFLTKHLLIDYRRGEAHFMRYLTDGDWASNNAGWQWSSGTGCDAQPYFRVFNPTLQGQRFDPNGDYVKTWVPELRHVPAKWIHAPWDAPAGTHVNYPKPIVDHAFARERYLALAKQHLALSEG